MLTIDQVIQLLEQSRRKLDGGARVVITQVTGDEVRHFVIESVVSTVDLSHGSIAEMPQARWLRQLSSM